VAGATRIFEPLKLVAVVGIAGLAVYMTVSVLRPRQVRYLPHLTFIFAKVNLVSVVSLEMSAVVESLQSIGSQFGSLGANFLSSRQIMVTGKHVLLKALLAF